MRIQIRTAGGNKFTLEVEPSDTVRDVISTFVKQEGIKTDGCWSGLFLPNKEYIPPGDSLSKHGIQSGVTLEFSNYNTAGCDPCFCKAGRYHGGRLQVRPMLA